MNGGSARSTKSAATGPARNENSVGVTLVHSRQATRLGNVLYWFLTGFAWLFLVAAAAVDIFTLWGAISLSERWVLNSIAAVIFLLVWLSGRACRYFLAGQ